MNNGTPKSIAFFGITIVSLALLLSSCGKTFENSSQGNDEEAIEARDSVDAAILSIEELKIELEKGLSGDSYSQERISNHLFASQGDHTVESLGWLVASAKSGNPVGVQALIAYLTSSSTQIKDQCELAEFWFTEINEESQKPSFLANHFSSKVEIRDEYFGLMREQIDHCWNEMNAKN